MSKPKLCQDCRHLYSPCGVTEECHHPRVTHIDLVNGLTRGPSAHQSRMTNMMLEVYAPNRYCGPEGLLWEQKGDNNVKR